MTTLNPAILPLVMHAIGMRYVIRKIFSILLPRVDNVADFVEDDKEFCENFKSRFVELDATQESLEMCRKALVEEALKEVSEYCSLLRMACKNLGFGKIAQRYLNTCKILEILLAWDKEKLHQLKAVVDSGDTDFGRLMMRISEVVDGRQNVYENFDDAAKTKATEDVRKISRHAETLAAMGAKEPLEQLEFQEVKQLECDAKLSEKVDEVGERIGGKVEAAKDELKDEIRELSRNVQDLSKRRGRGGRRRHSAARREMCMHCWNVAQKDSALRYSLNTRMTHEAAYNRYRHELENIGIESAAAFRRIIHSTQSLECHHRRKQLDEQCDAHKMRKCLLR